MKYIVTMEFVGHHDIELEADNDDEAIQMVGDYNIPHPFEDSLYDNSVEECIPVTLWQVGVDNKREMIWQT